jgi:hypothetical protein
VPIQQKENANDEERSADVLIGCSEKKGFVFRGRMQIKLGS